MAARLTPDRKVGSSNLSALTFAIACAKRFAEEQSRFAQKAESFITHFHHLSTYAGGIQSSVAYRGWVLKCIGAQHVLWIMSMTHPNQADRPQGSHHVSDGILVANDPGIGSGWQQSKQNWARPAVVGH